MQIYCEKFESGNQNEIFVNNINKSRCAIPDRRGCKVRHQSFALLPTSFEDDALNFCYSSIIQSSFSRVLGFPQKFAKHEEIREALVLPSASEYTLPGTWS
ncbi:hypothetical protein R1flu_010869 [Riccia fluitans]|uniref:Uncharacterized protein n=1 Tax=Riccia fluitans TaxID=41844 RepID=A0ABD1Z9A9_9MARC